MADATTKRHDLTCPWLPSHLFAVDLVVSHGSAKAALQTVSGDHCFQTAPFLFTLRVLNCACSGFLALASHQHIIDSQRSSPGQVCCAYKLVIASACWPSICAFFFLLPESACPGATCEARAGDLLQGAAPTSRLRPWHKRINKERHPTLIQNTLPR